MQIECVKKSLISDFKGLGKSALILLGIIIGACIVVYVYNIVRSIHVTNPISAEHLFIIMGIISIIGSFYMNMGLTKKSIDDEIFGAYCSGISFIVILYAFYCIFSVYTNLSSPGWYPDVSFIGSCLIITNIMITPFALAYVRCKE